MSMSEFERSKETQTGGQVDRTKRDGFQALGIAVISAISIVVVFLHFTQ